MEETRLVKQVYNHSRAEFVTQQKGNWVKVIYQLVQKYGLQAIWIDEQVVRQGQQEGKTVRELKQHWENLIYKQIQRVEEVEWKIDVESKPKLRTYRTFKTSLEQEPYLLSEKNKAGRYILTGLRSGTNRLRIETGRWRRPREAVEERVCLSCMEAEVEDEKHFMLHCRAHEALRDKMFRDIYTVSQGKYNLAQADPGTRWQVLMKGGEGIFRQPIFECVKIFARAAMGRRTVV